MPNADPKAETPPEPTAAADPKAGTPPERHPDALILPRPFQNDPEPQARITRLFKPLFHPSVRNLYVRAVNHETPQIYFVTGTPHCTRNYPTGHELASTPRYVWFVVGATDTSPLGEPKRVENDTDAPGSVRLGWLIDPDNLGVPSLDQKAEFERKYSESVRKLLPQYGELKRLSAIPQEKLSDKEKARMTELSRFFS